MGGGWVKAVLRSAFADKNSCLLFSNQYFLLIDLGFGEEPQFNVNPFFMNFYNDFTKLIIII